MIRGARRDFLAGFVLGLATVALTACLGAQVTGTKLLIAAAEARTTTIVAVKDLDHAFQEKQRARYLTAKTDEEVDALDKEVKDHNTLRDRIYTVLGKLFEQAVVLVNDAIQKKHVDLAPVLSLAREVPPLLTAFGVTDPKILGAFTLLPGGS